MHLRPPSSDQALYVGLMSGTSADGIDAVLLSMTDHKPELISHHSLPYCGRIGSSINHMR